MISSPNLSCVPFFGGPATVVNRGPASDFRSHLWCFSACPSAPKPMTAAMWPSFTRRMTLSRTASSKAKCHGHRLKHANCHGSNTRSNGTAFKCPCLVESRVITPSNLPIQFWGLHKLPNGSTVPKPSIFCRASGVVAPCHPPLSWVLPNTPGGGPNGGCPVLWRYPHSWMVYFMENPMKMDDNYRYPYFRKPPNG